MVQLVFVHGVATRDTAEYRQAVVNRNTLFRDNVFGPDVDFLAPEWGRHIPSIPPALFETDKGVLTYSLNVLPPTSLGVGLGIPPAPDQSPPGSNDLSIGAVGKLDPIAALDAICCELLDQATREGRPMSAEEVHVFRMATDLISSGNAAEVFIGDATGKAIDDRLREGMPRSFSMVSKISTAITAVSDRLRNAASTVGFKPIRDRITPAIGLFIGDVFVYLREGPLREKIRAEVVNALLEAHKAAQSGKGPVVLIGHSMGGVILVDLLMDAASTGLPTDFRADALITVGSQPGFFGSLGVLGKKVPAGQQLRRPDPVDLWLNVFDPIDPLAFRADMIFSGVEDLAFNSVTGVKDAHSKYFQRAQFYARTRTRLKDAGILRDSR